MLLLKGVKVDIFSLKQKTQALFYFLQPSQALKPYQG